MRTLSLLFTFFCLALGHGAVDAIDRALSFTRSQKVITAPEGILLLIDNEHKEVALADLEDSMDCTTFQDSKRETSICTMKKLGAAKSIRDFISENQDASDLEDLFTRLVIQEEGDFLDSIAPVIFVLPEVSDGEANQIAQIAKVHKFDFKIEVPEMVSPLTEKWQSKGGVPATRSFDYGQGFRVQFTFWLIIIVILIIVYFLQFFMYTCDASYDPVLYTKLPPS